MLSLGLQASYDVNSKPSMGRYLSSKVPGLRKETPKTLKSESDIIHKVKHARQAVE